MISIKAENLSKKYEMYSKPSHRVKEFFSFGRRKYHTEFWALKDINFEVEKGTTIGVIGQNGSGKSTLLKIISGITYPTTGDMKTIGRVSALIELGAGFHPEFSGRENVYMNASLMGIGSKEIDKKFEEILDFSELRHFIDFPVKTYSSGMHVRLAFSVAINVNPDILLIDEALSVGDALFQHKCIEKIKEFQLKGVTMFFVSHDTGAVKTLCEQVILLDRAEMIDMGEPGVMIDRYNELIAAREAKSVKSITIPKALDSAAEKGEKPKNIQKERRYGSSEARILTVRLLNESGQDRGAFISGDSIFIEVELIIIEQIEDVTVGILIRNRHGFEVYGINTYHKKLQIGHCHEGEKLVVRFKQKVNLSPGDYFITTAIHSKEKHLSECYDWWDNNVYFKILSAHSPFSGIVNLNSEIEISKKQLDSVAFQRILNENIFPEAPSVLAMGDESNCNFLLSGWYEEEKWDGEAVRWTRQTAVAVLKRVKTFSHIHIRVLAKNPDILENPLKGILYINNNNCGSFELNNLNWKEVSFPLLNHAEEIVKIKLALDRIWVPKNFNISNNSRELGLVVQRIWFS